MQSTRFPRRTLLGLVALAFVNMASAAVASDDAWNDIRDQLFDNRAIIEDGEAVRIVAPKRAEEAALVPVRVYISAPLAAHAKALTLVVDQNPVPVAAVFRFDKGYRDGGDVGDRMIETRIRLNELSKVRAIFETDLGELHMASQFVAGAGGCTSTAVKDMDEAMKTLGQMRVRIAQDATREKGWREANIQIRHPNFSGMQIDAKSNKYLPAHFVDNVDVSLGEAPLLKIESGMSISENPSFLITYADRNGDAIKAVVKDTEGNTFHAATGSGM